MLWLWFKINAAGLDNELIHRLNINTLAYRLQLMRIFKSQG